MVARRAPPAVPLAPTAHGRRDPATRGFAPSPSSASIPPVKRADFPVKPVEAAPATRRNKKAKDQSPYPDALVDFMMTDWRPRDGTLPEPMPHARAFASRRRALSKRFPGETLVIPTGHEKVRA